MSADFCFTQHCYCKFVAETIEFDVQSTLALMRSASDGGIDSICFLDLNAMVRMRTRLNVTPQKGLMKPTMASASVPETVWATIATQEEKTQN